MNRVSRRAALAAAAGLCFALSAQADQKPHPFTTNGYNNRTVWVTIYDLGKTRQLDYGCINATGTRKWTSGNYLFGSFYYIRAEVMDGNDCKGNKLCDTTVQVNPQVNLPPGEKLENAAHAIPHNTQWRLDGDGGGKCYWEKVTSRRLEASNGAPNWSPPAQSTTLCTQEVKLAYGVNIRDKAGADRIAATLKNLDGSYKKTCRNCRYYGPSVPGGGYDMPTDQLSADCQDGSQTRWVATKIESASKCKPNTTWNDNGQLKCTK